MMDIQAQPDNVDWRGVKRASRQFHVRAGDGDPARLLAGELAAASAPPAEVVIVDISHDDITRHEAVTAIAARYGYAIDPGFDAMLPPEERGGGVVRLVPSRWIVEDDRSDDALPLSGPNAGQRRCVESLQDYLIALLEEELVRCAVVPKGDVVEVLNVGSTSRGTYSALPVDFDVVAVTRQHGPEIPIDAARLMLDRMTARMGESREYADYCAAAGLDAGGGPAALHVRSLGMRGPESLVGRVSAVWSRGGEEAEHPILDLSLGALYRPAGYERWIRKYFAALDPAVAEGVRQQIRLAKEVLRRDGELYGSSHRAFRGHVVEQMVIQMHRYRHSRRAAGTLANAFAIIRDEAAIDDRAGQWRRFADAFPLWHTGVWEAAAAYGVELPPFNLWELIGDGDQALANHQWRRLQRCALQEPIAWKERA